MRKHLARSTTMSAAAGFATAVVLMVALAAFLMSIQPALATETRSENAGFQSASADPMVSAARRISIPFGIEAVQQVSMDGGQVSVTGHGFCWEEGQLFDLTVKVAQSTTHAFGEGRTIEECMNGERQTWSTVAEIGSDTPFEPGAARACATAEEFAKHGFADEHVWCKDIELSQASGGGY